MTLPNATLMFSAHGWRADVCVTGVPLIGRGTTYDPEGDSPGPQYSLIATVTGIAFQVEPAATSTEVDALPANAGGTRESLIAQRTHDVRSAICAQTGETPTRQSEIGGNGVVLDDTFAFSDKIDLATVTISSCEAP